MRIMDEVEREEVVRILREYFLALPANSAWDFSASGTAIWKQGIHDSILIELVHPGAAMALLGHRTPGLAYRHYVDARQVSRSKPTPPRIG